MLERNFTVPYNQRVLFTRGAFHRDNPVLGNLLAGAREGTRPNRALVFVDDHVSQANPTLLTDVANFASAHADRVALAGSPILLPGGEACKNDIKLVDLCWRAIHEAALDRHSMVF